MKILVISDQEVNFYNPGELECERIYTTPSQEVSKIMEVINSQKVSALVVNGDDLKNNEIVSKLKQINSSFPLVMGMNKLNFDNNPIEMNPFHCFTWEEMSQNGWFVNFKKLINNYQRELEKQEKIQHQNGDKPLTLENHQEVMAADDFIKRHHWNLNSSPKRNNPVQEHLDKMLDLVTKMNDQVDKVNQEKKKP